MISATINIISFENDHKLDIYLSSRFRSNIPPRHKRETVYRNTALCTMYYINSLGDKIYISNINKDPRKLINGLELKMEYIVDSGRYRTSASITTSADYKDAVLMSLANNVIDLKAELKLYITKYIVSNIKPLVFEEIKLT
ncbi:MAG: hypothetical protein KDH96_09940 [Candidatus Riesia sp.]|nr:hypothetical protein [Candidatus Riesia sp.]